MKVNFPGVQTLCPGVQNVRPGVKFISGGRKLSWGFDCLGLSTRYKLLRRGKLCIFLGCKNKKVYSRLLQNTGNRSQVAGQLEFPDNQFYFHLESLH